MKQVIQNMYKYDQSAKWWQVYLYPWFISILFHTYFSHPLYTKRFFFLARLISFFARFLTGIEIHPWAKIGKGLFIDHGMGVVIGETAEIWDDCIIFHGVTIGSSGKYQWKRHPTIGNNVLIWAHAVLLWPITVWNNSQVWAGSIVVNADIPDGATVVGNPWKIIRLSGERVEIIPKKL